MINEQRYNGVCFHYFGDKIKSDNAYSLNVLQLNQVSVTFERTILILYISFITIKQNKGKGVKCLLM